MDNETTEGFFKTMPSFKDELSDVQELNSGRQVTFSDEQLADFEDCFKRIDKSASGSVKADEVGSLLRAVGLNPSLKKLTEITNWLQSNSIESFTFEDFKILLERVWEDNNPTEELKEAFNVLDSGGNGFLTVDQLRKVLMQMGENLDEDDFKEILKSVPVQSDGTINNDGRNFNQ